MHYAAGPITNCIVWGNSASQSRELSLDWAPVVSYCCIRGWGHGGEGNTARDPLFAAGPLGDYYLSQTSAGQEEDSPCLDSGNGTAEELGLHEFTTRTDGGPDEGTVDIGYHYPVYDAAIEASLNAGVFAPGKTIEAFVSLENRACDVVVEVYVALILPDGMILCFIPDGLGFGVFPYSAPVLLPGGYAVGPLKTIDLTVPPEAPCGGYLYAAALSLIDGETFISMSVCPFTIESN